MNELNRQVVIFGHFSSIGFNIYTQLEDISKKYNFITDATPDFIHIQNEIEVKLEMGFIAPRNVQPQLRPTLRTRDGNVVVFFGANRIHVEQNNSNTESYEEFLSMAHEIIDLVIKKNDDICINRIALNGKIMQDDPFKIMDIYKKTFKSSKLYGTNSEEFSYRINTTEFNESLRNTTNKIIAFNCAPQVPTNEKKIILCIEYDYNTKTNTEMRYTFDDLKILTELTKNFKSLII